MNQPNSFLSLRANHMKVWDAKLEGLTSNATYLSSATPASLPEDEKALEHSSGRIQHQRSVTFACH